MGRAGTAVEVRHAGVSLAGPGVLACSVGRAGRRRAQGSATGASGKVERMGLLEIVLIVLLVLVLLGAFGYGGGAYRTPGIGLGGILLIIVLILLLT